MDPPTGRTSLPLRLTRRAWTILFLGLAIREAFSFWTGHPFDLESFLRTGYVVAHGGDPYAAFWPAVPGVSFDYLSTRIASTAYPPFWPLLLGGLYRLWEVVGGGNRFVLYFLIKQPAIAGDLLSAWLLYRIVGNATGDSRRALQVLTFWSLVPYTIIISALWGQFDALLVAVLLAALASRRANARVLLEGAGVVVKWLTGVLFPLELFRERGAYRLRFLLGMALALGAIGGSLWVLGWSFLSFRDTASSVSVGGPGGMNYVQLYGAPAVGWLLDRLPDSRLVSVFLWVPAALVTGYLASRWLREEAAVSTELRAVLFVLLAVLLVRSGLNEQYMLYLFAPLAIDVVAFHPGRRALFSYLVGVSLVFLLINNNLGIWFAAPVDPGLRTLATTQDTSVWLGGARTLGLDVLSVLVTLLLAQLLWVVYRDEASPVPWISRLFLRRSAAPFPGPGAPPSESSPTEPRP